MPRLSISLDIAANPLSFLYGTTAIYVASGLLPEFIADFSREFYKTNSGIKTFANAITHTRASTATYVDSTGTLQTAAINEPRLGHHVWNGTAWVNEGLLHESEARTNLIVQSADMTVSPWTLSNTTRATATGPFSGSTAFDIVENDTADGTVHSVQQVYSWTSGTTYTFSVWAKSSNRFIRLTAGNPAVFPANAFFNLQTGAVNSVTSGTATIQDFGNGWYRCSVTGVAASTALTNATFQLSLGNDTSYDGDGVSKVTLYGAQLEVAPIPSSYIPTNSGSAVTRAADVLTIPAANLPWPSPVVIGPELVTNGTFDTDLTGWTITATATAEVASASAEVEINVAASTAGIRQTLTTVAGKVYQVTGTIRNSTATNVMIRAVDGAGFVSPIIGETEAVAGTSDTSVSAEFVALSTQTTIYLRVAGAEGEVGYFDNISVREINPLAVSIQMDGRVTYADNDGFSTVSFYLWQLDANNMIQNRIDTSLSTGELAVRQRSLGVDDYSNGANGYYSPDILVPINVASRSGSTFVRGAYDGTLASLNSTPTALPDLSAANLTLGSTYNGTIRTFRLWANDIGDAGLVEATEPSLVPSLSLTFDGTENSFIVEDWSE